MIDIVLLVGKFFFLLILYLFVYMVIRATTRDMWAAAAGAGDRPTPGVEDSGTWRAATVSSTLQRGRGWVLRVLGSPCIDVGRFYDLPVGNQALVGRSTDMDIHLQDTFVSSRHAVFEATSDGLYVEDLRSTNGTLVNGERISGTRLLKVGDRVEVGDTVFGVEAA